MKDDGIVFKIKLSEDQLRITQNNDGVELFWYFTDYEDPWEASDHFRYDLYTLLESHVSALVATLKSRKAQAVLDKTKGTFESEPEQDEKYDWL